MWESASPIITCNIISKIIIIIAAIISVAAGKSYAAVRSLPPMIAMQSVEEAQAEWRESNCWDRVLRDFIPCEPDYVYVMQESKVRTHAAEASRVQLL